MSTVLRLRAHELADALAGSDAPRAVVDELVWREIADNTPTLSQRRLGGWRLQPGVDDDLVLLHGEHSRSGLLLPAAGLRAVRGAALTAVVATMFVAPRVVTVSVLGSGLAARLQIIALAAHVPGVSHVAVHVPEGGRRVPAAIAERLDGAGIGLTVTECGADAVFGANLVVLAGPHAAGDWSLPHGAVVVNASGRQVPVKAGQVFVDDRRFLADAAGTADLGQVLAGTHPGRAGRDGVLLVDLRSMDSGGVWLTHQLYQAALRHGLGVPAGAEPESYQGGMWP
jgi:ornithine cyclodeaminase/alanine dehydrogenase-like protein (mu-crystallin family)